MPTRPARKRQLAALDPDAGSGDYSDIDPPASSTTPTGPTPVPSPSAQPASAEREQDGDARKVRQTLDLPAGEYRTLHRRSRDLADELAKTSREVNAQTVLRHLVHRMLTHDEVWESVRQDVMRSVGQ